MSSIILPKGLDRPAKFDEPQLRGDSVCATRYTDADYLKKEFQNVWHKVWNIGGVSYQMPEPGDYLTTELGQDSLLWCASQTAVLKPFLTPARIAAQ